MDIIQDYILQNAETIPLIVLVAFVLATLFGIIQGNSIPLILLNKCNIPVISGKIHKDFKVAKRLNNNTKGFLFVPDVCYNVVLQNTDDYNYKQLNLLNKENRRGELYVPNESSKFVQYVLNLSLDKDKGNTDEDTFKDLTLIKGTTVAKKINPRNAKFTFLKKYTKTEQASEYPIVKLAEKGRVRNFTLLCALEKGIDDKMHFDFTNRESFLEGVLTKSYVVNQGQTSNLSRPILILNGGNDLDALLVFLIEVEG